MSTSSQMVMGASIVPLTGLVGVLVEIVAYPGRGHVANRARGPWQGALVGAVDTDEIEELREEREERVLSETIDSGLRVG